MSAWIWLVLAGTVAAKPADWVVLPARGERPPPRDPTLMRLTDALAEAISGAVSARVTVVARDLADQACPGDSGDCPRDLAILVSAERAVTLTVKEDQSGVDLRVYKQKIGLEKTLSLPCKWTEGLLACATEGLAALVPGAAAVAPAPATPTKGKAKATPSAPDPIEIALLAIDKKTARCRAKGWGELAIGDRPKEMAVRFRVAPDGTIKDVRLDPSGFADVPAFACMARAVESTVLAPGVVDDAPRQRALPLP